jgi:hypothetical protein
VDLDRPLCQRNANIGRYIEEGKSHDESSAFPLDWQDALQVFGNPGMPSPDEDARHRGEKL